MSDLIDRNALIEKMNDFAAFAAAYKPYKSKDDIAEDVLRQAKKQALRMVKETPTVEAKPVIKGEWIKRVKNNGGYVASITCSACGYAHSRVTYNFCPECGASMRIGGANNV